MKTKQKDSKSSILQVSVCAIKKKRKAKQTVIISSVVLHVIVVVFLHKAFYTLWILYDSQLSSGNDEKFYSEHCRKIEKCKELMERNWCTTVRMVLTGRGR